MLFRNVGNYLTSRYGMTYQKSLIFKTLTIFHCSLRKEGCSFFLDEEKY